MTTAAVTPVPPSPPAASPSPAAPVERATRRGYGLWSIVALAVALGVARVAYLGMFCPYTLVEDEAHYWEWARRLDWSYYSKGPGIALAIRAFTSLMGDTEFAVRLPAAVASIVSALFVGLLAADVAGRRGSPCWRIGFYGAAAFALAPVMQAVGLVSTIDGPCVACWAVACWAGWRAMERGSRWAWVTLGAAVGVGFLFKYTILLLPPGLLAYALLRRWGEGEVSPARTWGRWAAGGALLTLAGLSPVLIWNMRHGWPTVLHLLGHLGLAAGDMPPPADPGRGWSPKWFFEFIGVQFGIVGPALVLACAGAAWGVWSWWEAALRLRRAGVSTRALPTEEELEPLSGMLYLVCCAAPVLAFYLVVALVAEAEGNWAMGAYVTLLPLAGWIAADHMREYGQKLLAWRRFAAGDRPWSGILRRRPETPGQMLWHAAIVYGLVAGVGMLRLDLVQAGLARADAGLARLGVRTSLAGVVPTGRFLNADEMGRNAAELAADLRVATGLEPFIVAQHYGRASQLAFYMPGRPTVYCASSRTGGRRTQYDLWPETDLDDPALLGRPAIVVGRDAAAWQQAFYGLSRLGPLRGDGKGETRPAFVGVGFLGLPRPGERAVAGGPGRAGGVP